MLEAIVAVDENGQKHGPYAPAVARELARMGIIWRDGSGWRIRAADVTIVELNPHIAVCDFCSTQPVVWDCVADDFTHDEPGTGPLSKWTSTGGFAACEACGRLVLARDRAGLLKRAIDCAVDRSFRQLFPDRAWIAQVIQIDPRFERELRKQLVPLHALFWQHFKRIERIVH